MLVEPPEQVSHNRSLASSAIDRALALDAYRSHGAVVAPSVDEGGLSQTAVEATRRTRSPIAPGSVRVPGG